MTLEELKRTAPRSFDKTLIDLLVAIQYGGTPIVAPPETVREVVRMEADPAATEVLRDLAEQVISLKRQVHDMQQTLALLQRVEIFRPEQAA